MSSITVSKDNGNSATEITTEAEAEEFLSAYGINNYAAEVRAAGLDSDGDTHLECLAKLASACARVGEVPTLP